MLSIKEKTIATDKLKLTAYAYPQVSAAIVKESQKERRSKSNMIELLIEEALVARGYTFTIPLVIPDDL